MAKLAIKLIVGLGNPGHEYEQTRHNAGFWFIEKLISAYNIPVNFDKKFAAICGQSNGFHILMPQKFMNLSGQSVQPYCQFYKITPEEILVVHDELDLPTGVVRLKKAGGPGGHNGLKDIINKLSSPNFYRLRIGIGHPREVHSQHPVHDYVLSKPNNSDKSKIMDSIDAAFLEIPNILTGDIQNVMKKLHT